MRRIIPLCAIMPAVFFILFHGMIALSEESPKKDELNWEEMILSGDRHERPQGRAIVEANRKEIIEGLMCIVRQPVREGEDVNNKNSSRNTAILLLGKLRAEEAAGELVGWLGVKEGQGIMIWSIGSAVNRPAAMALIQIGLPSVPAVMKVLKEDDAEVRNQGIRVLASVVGLSEAEMLLEQAVKSEQDETAKKNLEAALSSMEDSRMRPTLEKLDKERTKRLLGKAVN